MLPLEHPLRLRCRGQTRDENVAAGEEGVERLCVIGRVVRLGQNTWRDQLTVAHLSSMGASLSVGTHPPCRPFPR